MGAEGIKEWHASTRKRGLRELAGNSNVKNQVASGGCDFGFTDTDDFFLARDAGAPVDLVPVRLPGGETIVIPNTVAMVAGCRNQAHAQRFIDYLLSEETELALANSPSRQIPLGPVDGARLNADVRSLMAVAGRGCSLEGLDDIRTTCVAWLKQQ